MKRTEILASLAFLLFVQGYLLQNVFSALLASAIVIYTLFLRVEFSPSVRVKWNSEKNAVEGRAVKTEVVLRNLSGIPLEVSILSDFLPVNFEAKDTGVLLDSDEEKSVVFEIKPPRGEYRIRGPKIRISDLRGIYSTEFLADTSIELVVRPSIDRIKEELEAERNIRLAAMYKKAMVGLHSMDVESLKKFQPGDDTKHIDWKATARLGEIIVREFLREVEGDVYIILDAGRQMRKGVKRSKIDYASSLTMYLSRFLLRRYSVGLIMYDDFGVIRFVEASPAPEQLNRISSSLTVSPLSTEILRTRIPDFGFRMSERSQQFLKKVLPAIKRKKSLSSGILEAVGRIPSASFLILISDITSNTSELVKVLLRLRGRHRMLVLTPNPILFLDPEKIDRNQVVQLYRRYVEREEIIRKMNRIVPTLDLGPSDFIEVVRGGLS